MKSKNQKGFTLIELLVVIAIISILASIIVPSFQSAIQRSKAVNIANDLSKIEKAFHLHANEHNLDNIFPTESKIGFTNPEIRTLVDQNKLSFVSEYLKATGLGNEIYVYDNDGDVYNYLSTCPGLASNTGANIMVFHSRKKNDYMIIEELDSIFDNSDGLNCGKIRNHHHHNALFFSLKDNK